jgi:hypothetical protein
MDSLDMFICATMNATATVCAVRSRDTERMGLPMPSHCTPEERFWSNTLKTSGCWLWQGKRDRKGYGVFSLKNCQLRAHRVAYEFR